MAAGCLCNEFRLLTLADERARQSLDDLLPFREMELTLLQLVQEPGQSSQWPVNSPSSEPRFARVMRHHALFCTSWFGRMAYCICRREKA